MQMIDQLPDPALICVLQHVARVDIRDLASLKRASTKVERMLRHEYIRDELDGRCRCAVYDEDGLDYANLYETQFGCLPHHERECCACGTWFCSKQYECELCDDALMDTYFMRETPNDLWCICWQCMTCIMYYGIPIRWCMPAMDLRAVFDHCRIDHADAPMIHVHVRVFACTTDASLHADVCVLMDNMRWSLNLSYNALLRHVAFHLLYENTEAERHKDRLERLFDEVLRDITRNI